MECGASWVMLFYSAESRVRQTGPAVGFCLYPRPPAVLTRVPRMTVTSLRLTATIAAAMALAACRAEASTDPTPPIGSLLANPPPPTSCGQRH